MTDIWAQLGIEATSDLKAIKRAYAARLKHTRPDDDAAAYQALREAYEMAQIQADWMRQMEKHVEIVPPVEPDDTSIQIVFDAPAAAQDEGIAVEGMDEFDATAPSSGRYIEPAVFSGRMPAELALAFKQRLETGGASATLAEWKILEGELDELPLSMRDETSRCFADVAISARNDLPLSVRNALLRRFGWFSDFREIRILGIVRMQALHSRFGAVFVPDEAFFHHHREVYAFVQGVLELKGWKQSLYIMLADSRIRRLWRELQPAQREAMGVRQTDQDHINDVLYTAIWLKAVLLVALSVIILAWTNDHAAEAWGILLSAAIILGFLGRTVPDFIYALASAVRQPFQHHVFGSGNGRLWRGIPVRTLAAIACLTFAVACVAALERGAWT